MTTTEVPATPIPGWEAELLATTAARQSEEADARRADAEQVTQFRAAEAEAAAAYWAERGTRSTVPQAGDLVVARGNAYTAWEVRSVSEGGRTLNIVGAVAEYPGHGGLAELRELQRHIGEKRTIPAGIATFVPRFGHAECANCARVHPVKFADMSGGPIYQMYCDRRAPEWFSGRVGAAALLPAER